MRIMRLAGNHKRFIRFNKLVDRLQCLQISDFRHVTTKFETAWRYARGALDVLERISKGPTASAARIEKKNRTLATAAARHQTEYQTSFISRKV
jgi:hypothetical protein